MGLFMLDGDSPFDDPVRAGLAILAILILIIVLTRLGWKRRRRRSSRPARERSPTPVAPERALHAAGEVSEVLVQIQSLTREIEGRLDTRVRHANRLLQESEQVLTRLEQLIHEARGIVGEGRLDARSSVRRSEPATEDPEGGAHVDVVSDPVEAPAPEAPTPAAAGPSAETVTNEDLSIEEEHIEIHQFLKFFVCRWRSSSITDSFTPFFGGSRYLGRSTLDRRSY